jgi:hypothetical protein
MGAARNVAAPVLLSNTNVLVPQRGIGSDEVPHEIDAGPVLHHVYRHAAGSKQFLFAEKCLILADHDPRDSIKQDGA